MRRLVSGIVLAIIVAASLGCGSGLSESEVEQIAYRAVLDAKEVIVKDLTQNITEDFGTVI